VHLRVRSAGLPATVRVRFRNGDLAEMAAWLRGVQRVYEKTVTITDDDPLLYQTSSRFC
jgi:D-amino peptidase